MDKIFYNEGSAAKLNWDPTWFNCSNFGFSSANKLLNSFVIKSLNEIKNKYKDDVIKIVFKRKFKLIFLIINNDNNNEIIKKENKCNLFLISDFIHFNFGPIAIINKNGIKNGIINL